MKILVIQQKMIGDVLTTSILFEALKEKFKTAELHYLINTHTFPVIENNPFIDKIIYFTPKIEENKWNLIALIKLVRRNKYDVVIDVYGKLSSYLITSFSGAKLKIGYFKKQTSFLYSHPIIRLKQPINNESLAIENRMRLLEPLEISFKNISPKIYLQQSEIDKSEKLLHSFSVDTTKPLFMIAVLGSHPKKTYPAEYMAKLLDLIVQERPNAQLLFNYIPKQIDQAKEIFNLCNPETQKQIFIDLYGKSIREFIAITFHCNALIGNEGGAVNMAKGIHIPTFIIFNPSLNKANWFGDVEYGNNEAVHLSDYIPYKKNDLELAKQNPELYYQKFKPTFIEPKLSQFLRNLK